MKVFKFSFLVMVVFSLGAWWMQSCPICQEPLHYTPFLITILFLIVFAIPLFTKRKDRGQPAKHLTEFSTNNGLKWSVLDEYPEYGQLCINWHMNMLNDIKFRAVKPTIFPYDVDCASRSDELDFRRVVCTGTYIGEGSK